MNCIVTAGPAFELLDDVRWLTSFSCGNLEGILSLANPSLPSNLVA